MSSRVEMNAEEGEAEVDPEDSHDLHTQAKELIG